MTAVDRMIHKARSCLRKVAYPSEKIALHDVFVPRKFRVYKCDFCQWWHLTKRAPHDPQTPKYHRNF